MVKKVGVHYLLVLRRRLVPGTPADHRWDISEWIKDAPPFDAFY